MYNLLPKYGYYNIVSTYSIYLSTSGTIFDGKGNHSLADYNFDFLVFYDFTYLISLLSLIIIKKMETILF